MRQEYGKALRTLFAEGIARRFGAWQPQPAGKPWYWPGERLYVCRRDDLWWVVVLEPDCKDHDAFSLSVGWSRLNRVPQLSMRPSMEAPLSLQAMLRDEYLCPLPLLIPQRPRLHGHPAPWLIDPRSASRDPLDALAAFIDRQRSRPSAEEARAILAPLVEDALDALQRWGIPYLEELPQAPYDCSRAS